MKTYITDIELAAKDGYDALEITRRVFFLFPTHAFQENFARQFDLYQEVANFFQVPFNSIHIVGSAKTGHSLVKGTQFKADGSDIDIAVIDSALYLRYVELAFEKSRGWRDQAAFPPKARDSFLQYLNKGMFRPDLMPYCAERGKWLSFFGRLSGEYIDLCSGISACLYASATFFEWKQKVAVEAFLANSGLAP